MPRILREFHCVLRTLGVIQRYACPGMRHAGRDAEHDRCVDLFRKFKAVLYHFVCLLLARWLEEGYHGKFGVVASILFVLRAMHRGVVRADHHDSSVHPRNRRVHERIGCHVHPNVFKSHHCSSPCVAHPQSGFHRGLLVRRPSPVYISFGRYGGVLYVLHNFS